MGLFWANCGVFINRKVMSRVDCYICPKWLLYLNYVFQLSWKVLMERGVSQEMKWMPGFNSWFVVRAEYTSLLVGRSVF